MVKGSFLASAALAVSVASAARPPSADFTFLGDLLPTYSASAVTEQNPGFLPYQVNARGEHTGFTQYVLNDDGGKVPTHFSEGVFTHAPAHVHYHIEGKYSRFEACVGLDVYSGSLSNAACDTSDGVTFQVRADGKNVFERTQMMGEAQTCFSINLEVIDPSKNAQTLELIVDRLGNSVCDEAEWVNAKLFEDPIVDCMQLGSLVPQYTSIGWGSYWVNRRWHENGFQVAGAKYSNGVFAHAPSHIIYPLHGKYDTFSSCVGIDDASATAGAAAATAADANCGDATFSVLVDGVERDFGHGRGTSITMVGQQRVECFAVNVHGAEHLELVVNENSDSTCDETEWVNANVCREEPKPIDCQVGNWTGWDGCSKSCGTGFETNTRPKIKDAEFGGRACLSLTKTRQCNIHPCPINCQESQWGGWVTCSQTCGGGLSYRYRSEDRSAAFGGVECGDLHEKESCNTKPCPIDCQVTDWTAWDPCTKECGGGWQWQRRTELVPASGEGAVGCPDLAQKRTCNDHDCAIDCQMTKWGKWESCNVDCGGGIQKRNRVESRETQHGGKDCPAAEERRECNIAECPVNCELSDWSQFPDCSVTCGSGTRTRYRSIDVTSAFGGTECGELTDPETCNTQHCPVDCVMEPWSGWEDCTADCGGGVETRRRGVDVEMLWDGEECGDTEETRPCNVHACAIDCQDHGFGDWGDCTKSCASGRQTRYRNITQAQFGGVQCDETLAMSDQQYCNVFPCPQDCQVTEWEPWSDCDEECGEGSMFRTRAHVQDPSSGGQSCPHLREERKCNTHECPVDCVLTPFTPFTNCSKACGGGFQTSYAEIRTPAQHGGSCPDLNQTRPCNPEPCEVDCIMGNWGTATECSHTCGDNGHLSRFRPILRQPSENGQACTPTEETTGCWAAESNPCPVDCVLSEWGGYSDCSDDCGGGTQVSTRSVVQNPSGTGEACDWEQASRTRNCNLKRCPVTCIISDFSDWGDCSRTCGNGIMRRTASIVDMSTTINGDRFQSSYTDEEGLEHAMSCPKTTDVSECKLAECPVDCKVSLWGGWSNCSKSCDTGFKSRSRYPIQSPNDEGEPCPDLMTDVKFCNTVSCEAAEAAAEPFVWVPYSQVRAEREAAEAAARQVHADWTPPVYESETRTTTAAPEVTYAAGEKVTIAPDAPDREGCTWGEGDAEQSKEVPHGWAGAGYGDNFCNLVRCNDGDLETVNERDCLAEFRHGGTKCNTVTCDYYAHEGRPSTVNVHHESPIDPAEAGGHHHCAYNLATNKCECRCFAAPNSAALQPERPTLLHWERE
jgi:hypothetical protein